MQDDFKVVFPSQRRIGEIAKYKPLCLLLVDGVRNIN